jgi:hypothetical protein
LAELRKPKIGGFTCVGDGPPLGACSALLAKAGLEAAAANCCSIDADELEGEENGRDSTASTAADDERRMLYSETGRGGESHLNKNQ